MRAVNLASKPFVNRRPVIRVAILVWALTIGLIAINFWRYGDFFRVASSQRSRLSDLEKNIRIEEEQVEGLRRRINALDLDVNNGKARYLNGLIHQRIFPWSRLFDEIEALLPKDVYLSGLAPQIEEVEKTQQRRKTTTRRTGKSRAKVKSVQRVPEKVLDQVELELVGSARSEEALLELVDRLYASPTFLEPVLSYERREERTGLVSFKIDVIYLTRASNASDSATAGGAEAELSSADRFGAGSDAAGDGASPRGAREITGGRRSSGGDAAGGDAAGGNAAGTLYGQSGFPAPQGPADRPGFGSAGGAVDPNQPSAGGRNSSPSPSRQGVTPRGTNQRGSGLAQPGLAQPGSAQPGSIVVPPRRSPGALQPVQSSSPRLGGG